MSIALAARAEQFKAPATGPGGVLHRVVSKASGGTGRPPCAGGVLAVICLKIRAVALVIGLQYPAALY